VADDRGVGARVVRVDAEGTSVAVVGVEGANVLGASVLGDRVVVTKELTLRGPVWL
jgi:hypothetical protein